jgi:aspartyl-tRNA(Asn)/glutamyl-tRNA(Gln) amidotransferase subunit B
MDIPVIGLEIHAQLATASKMFCACAASGDAGPNARTCPVCLGLPGALPVLNSRAVDLGVMAAAALGCRIERASVFARKHYFYPDLPKGYQITQHDRPLALAGRLTFTSTGGEHTVRIRRVHLEEDAGKSTHPGEAGQDGRPGALIDFNRSGVPLVEIVTEPDLESPADAAAAFETVRDLLVAIGVCDGNMEQGNVRCDANVSLRRGAVPGARVEIKNLNSFRFLQRALEYEIGRQGALLAAGGVVESATRLFDQRSGETASMRTKEASADYRYLPEPDLPRLVVEADRVARLVAAMPELPDRRRARLAAAYALASDEADILGASAPLAAYFEATTAACGDAAAAARWITGELARRMKERGLTLDALPVTPASLGRLIVLVRDGHVSASAAKHILGRMSASGESADAIVAAEALGQESDPLTLAALVDEVLARHPSQVAQYLAGTRAVAAFLTGAVMKASGGRANPRVVDRLVHARLDAPGER